MTVIQNAHLPTKRGVQSAPTTTFTSALRNKDKRIRDWSAGLKILGQHTYVGQGNPRFPICLPQQLYNNDHRWVYTMSICYNKNCDNSDNSDDKCDNNETITSTNPTPHTYKYKGVAFLFPPTLMLAPDSTKNFTHSSWPCCAAKKKNRHEYIDNTTDSPSNTRNCNNNNNNNQKTTITNLPNVAVESRPASVVPQRRG